MKEFSAGLLKTLIEKLELKQLLLSLLFVLGFIHVPRINFLEFVLCLDRCRKLPIFILSFLACFFCLEIIKWIFKTSKTCIKSAIRKRRGKREHRAFLKESVPLLSGNHKKILMGFVKNKNQPISLLDSEASKLVAMNILDEIPHTKEYSSAGILYHRSYYKVNPHIFLFILELKKRTILTE